MKYHMMLIMIICFWFIEFSTLAFVSQDVVLEQVYQGSFNATITYNQSTSFENLTTNNPSSTSKGFIDSTLRLFSFRIPNYLLPTALNFFVTFLNWLLVFILEMCIYRIANPLV